MIGGERPPEALGQYTGFLLNWAAARSREAFAHALAEIGLHPQQFAVLSMVAERPGETQQLLVQWTGVDASTMVAILDDLTEAGLAERRSHPTDRRKRSIHLTKAGTAALKKARTAAGKVGDEAFGRLTKSEREDFHRLLRKMTGLDQ